MQKKDIVEQLKSICDRYSDILGTVILFGSYSRNEANDNSDIDLYVEPIDRSMTTSQFGANKRYKEFKCTLYDSFSTNFDILAYGGKRDLANIKRSPIWTRIMKDGVVIYDQGTKAI